MITYFTNNYLSHSLSFTKFANKIVHGDLSQNFPTKFVIFRSSVPSDPSVPFRFFETRGRRTVLAGSSAVSRCNFSGRRLRSRGGKKIGESRDHGERVASVLPWAPTSDVRGIAATRRSIERPRRMIFGTSARRRGRPCSAGNACDGGRQ